MSASLSMLEKQLADLQKLPIMAPPPSPAAVIEPTVTVSLTDLRSMVQEMVNENKIGVAEAAIKPPKEYTLLEAINLGLSNDEQTWLLKEDVIKGVANFMATKEGLEITKLFITNYRNYYES